MDIGDMDTHRSTSCWWILISFPWINQLNCKSLFSEWLRAYFFFWNILVLKSPKTSRDVLDEILTISRQLLEVNAAHFRLITAWLPRTADAGSASGAQKRWRIKRKRAKQSRDQSFPCTWYTVHISNNAVNGINMLPAHLPFREMLPEDIRTGSRWNMREAEMGLGASQGEIPVNARPSQLWKSAIGYASIQLGRYTVPSAGVCSLNSAWLIRIYLTSVGRRLHSLQKCTNNSRAQAAVRTKGTFNGKRGRTRVRGIAVGE